MVARHFQKINQLADEKQKERQQNQEEAANIKLEKELVDTVAEVKHGRLGFDEYQTT